MATYSGIPAWEVSWTEEPGGLQSVESQWVRHNWTCAHTQGLLQPEKQNRATAQCFLITWDFYVHPKSYLEFLTDLSHRLFMHLKRETDSFKKSRTSFTFRIWLLCNHFPILSLILVFFHTMSTPVPFWVFLGFSSNLLIPRSVSTDAGTLLFD